MLINCAKIANKLILDVNKLELHTISGDRICQYYTGVIKVKDKTYIEIPVCAVDVKYLLVSKFGDAISFYSKDRTIKNAYMCVKNKGKMKMGCLYIDSNILYRMIN